uniref:Deoxyribonuclease-2-alpha n=1 Tax=Urocitellus parryii TaxID=9999 RepID=A0A8D2HBH5_UROPR
MAELNRLLLVALLWVPAGALSCYGDSGQPVDWFVVYKLPAHSHPGDAVWRGMRYKYLDDKSGGWRDGAGSINSSTGAVGRSLLPLYRGNTSQASCSWTKKGAFGWSTACHVSLHPPPLVHTAGLIMLKHMDRLSSVCLFPFPSSQRLAGN